MCMCIPPSKTQRDINPTQDTIYTLAWVLVNLLATCDLLGSWVLLSLLAAAFRPEHGLLSDAFARISAEAGMGQLWTNPRKREATTPKSVK